MMGCTEAVRKRIQISGGPKRVVADTGEKKRQRMDPATPHPHCLHPFFALANQAPASPACRLIRSRNRSSSRGPRLPQGGRPEPACPALQAPPTPRPLPPKARPAAVSRACPEFPGRRPAAGAQYCLKGRKKRKGGRVGNCQVTGRGYTTFSFTIDNLAPMYERDGIAWTGA